ncbi:MAG: endolytic transglycosylase MltG [Patescibacteria group bacterium]|nr:endolytic transglycosylase MltG [Patescibacteria group bacterium]
MQLKRKKNKYFLGFKKIGFLILVVFLIYFFSYIRDINHSSERNQNVVFKIDGGSSISEIGESLYEQDLIKSKFTFKLYIHFSKEELIFREGSYNLNYNMNIKEIVEELTKKISLKPEKTVTFIEGWSVRDYYKVLEKNFSTEEENFFNMVGEPMLNYQLLSSGIRPKDFSEQFDFLKDKPSYYGLEGYLFPDTYRFFEDASLEDVIIRMLKNFDQKLTSKMREDIITQGKTIFEIVTMASIIQKEVQSEDDMKMVSGLFWNRIKNGQALESCATLAYILGVNKAIYSREDTRTPSAYNTYINRGLPPGPISNPGLKAIEAAIYPTENNYNYFLSRPDTKETIFSITYEEHLLNKNKYLK